MIASNVNVNLQEHKDRSLNNSNDSNSNNSNSNNSNIISKSKKNHKELASNNQIKKINNLLFAVENTVINDSKSKYVLVRLFINKVLDPLSIYCLTDFVQISKELLVKNEQRNRDLLRAYSETFNKIIGTKSIITKDTPDDKIKKDYIIKFIKQSVGAMGYVMTGKITNKTTREVHYTIKLLPNMIMRK